MGYGVKRPCPTKGALAIKGEVYQCDAMDGMHDSSETHQGWPHSNREAEAIWSDDSLEIP